MIATLAPEMDTSTTPDSPAIAGLATAIVEAVGRVPASDEPVADDPRTRADRLARATAGKTAALSAVAALPPGPIGWITLLPEAAAIWRLQAQLVADIAAAHGRTDVLTSELLLHCLFSHSADRPIGGMVLRVGERLLVRTVSYRMLQPIARSIAVRLSRRTLARGVARFVPGVGSAAVAALSWRETRRVATNALDAFSRPIDVREQMPGDEVPVVRDGDDAPRAGPGADHPQDTAGGRPRRRRARLLDPDADTA